MPPKKKKNPPRNAFYYYMLDYKTKKEAEGHVFPRGLKDASDAADLSWKGLDPRTKSHYENLAERAKITGNGGVRYNTQGQTYEEVEREKQEADMKKAYTISSITNHVQSGGRNGLKLRRFYFIHLNHYGAMEDQRFIPCEVAVLAYSVELGFMLENIFHEFIKNMELPHGYTFRAKSQMEATHKCPLPPYAMGTSNHPQIYKTILSLMEKNGDLEDGRPPPIYTLAQMIPEAVDFFAKGNEFLPKENRFTDIFPLEELFFQMKNFGLKPEGQHLFFNGIEDKGFPFLANAADILKGDIYDYSSGIACQFHEDQDVRQHCSRSYVIRWSYLFSDHLCANLDVPVVSERHTPRGTNFNSVMITTQMDQMSLRVNAEGPRESCGRGKPVDGRTVPMTRIAHPQPSPNNDWLGEGSSSSRSSSRIGNDMPLTIIDHSQFQIDESDYVPPAPRVQTAYEITPLRLPKSKGKSSLLQNARQAQAQVSGGSDEYQNHLLGGVGRGRGLLKFP